MIGHEAKVQVLLGFLMVWLIQKAKASSWGMFKFISVATPGICRGASALMALLVSAGITWSAMESESGYTIIIQAPHLEELLHWVVGAAYQYLAQEVQYQSLLKPNK